MNFHISPHMIFFLPHSGVIFESQFLMYKNENESKIEYVRNGIKLPFKTASCVFFIFSLAPIVKVLDRYLQNLSFLPPLDYTSFIGCLATWCSTPVPVAYWLLVAFKL